MRIFLLGILHTCVSELTSTATVFLRFFHKRKSGTTAHDLQIFDVVGSALSFNGSKKSMLFVEGVQLCECSEQTNYQQPYNDSQTRSLRVKKH